MLSPQNLSPLGETSSFQPASRYGRWAIWGIVLLLGGVYLYNSLIFSQGSLKRGVKAPLFRLKSVNAPGEVYLKDSIGKPILLFFWSIYCPNCKDALGIVEKLHRAYKPEKIRVFSLHIDQGDIAPILQYLQRYQYTLPTLLDRENLVAEMYKVFQIPVAVLIDKSGRIFETFVGSISYKTLKISLDQMQNPG